MFQHLDHKLYATFVVWFLAALTSGSFLKRLALRKRRSHRLAVATMAGGALIFLIGMFRLTSYLGQNHARAPLEHLEWLPFLAISFLGLFFILLNGWVLALSVATMEQKTGQESPIG